MWLLDLAIAVGIVTTMVLVGLTTRWQVEGAARG
jgi:hypothetical protein